MRFARLLRVCAVPLFAAAIVGSCATEEPAHRPATKTASAQARSGAFDITEVTLAPAHEVVGDIVIDVAFATTATVGLRNTPYWVFFGAGALSVPLAVINPFYGLGVLYPVVGPPLNAVFNARRDKLVRAMVDVPLPAAVAAAIKARLGEARLPPAAHISLLISDYGLVPRSGITPDALHFGDDPMMCLTAEATLHVTRVGRKDRNDRLAVSFANKSPDAPPPLCAKISRLIHDDGVLMRQSIRELAEILAVMALNRVGPVVPLSYQQPREPVQRKVGKLRVLAVLAIHQRAPQACGKVYHGDTEISPLTGPVKDMVDYLTSVKGYEVRSLDPARYSAWLRQPGNAAFVTEVSEWFADTREETRPGPLTRSLLEQIRRNEAVDGLLIVYIHDSCNRALWPLRALQGLSTLGLSELLPAPQDQEIHPAYRVSILAVASGRPVWRNSREPHETFGSFRRSRSYSEILFEDLDSAMPKLLTR